MTRHDRTHLDMTRHDRTCRDVTFRHQDHPHRGQRAVWQSSPGQGIPAFLGGRIIPTRRIDAREAAYRRTIQFGTTKVSKLTKTTLVNMEVHLFIQYIHQLLRQEAFDESVLGNMIDTETISFL